MPAWHETASASMPRCMGEIFVVEFQWSSSMVLLYYRPPYLSIKRGMMNGIVSPSCVDDAHDAFLVDEALSTLRMFSMHCYYFFMPLMSFLCRLVHQKVRQERRLAKGHRFTAGHEGPRCAARPRQLQYGACGSKSKHERVTVWHYAMRQRY